MKLYCEYYLNVFTFFIVFLIFIYMLACTSTSTFNSIDENKNTEAAKTEFNKKPPSTYQDSLFINFNSAVFFQPDSLQLCGIQKLTDSSIFDGIMHEYLYLIKNAKSVLKGDWPNIQIIDAKNKRYLCFISKDKNTHVVDLNKHNDSYGLFIFNPIGFPVLVDMSNINDALYMHFSK